MESKKTYRIKVGEKVFKVDAHSKYHAIDKVYSAFYKEENNRNKYKVIK
jgi:hypothetical protein